MNVSPESTSQPRLLSPGRIICALIAIVSLALSLWVVTDMILHPFSGPRVLHVLLIVAATAVFIYFSLTIPQSYYIKQRGHRFLAGIPKWLLTLFLPLFVVTSVTDLADRRTITIAGDELAPVIEYLDSEFRLHEEFPADIVAILEENVTGLTNVNYFRGDSHYVLQTRGSSTDIDGATLFYISTDRVWRRAHNDMIDASVTENAKMYADAVNGLAEHAYGNYRSGKWEKLGY